ncbi:hypothetical protein A2701_00120 [Candidatus Amesbacteria bacterium RIFCSPHIGHO2_01_FULL_47_34]|nr:MAG: hypothetical protein A2701_00120 [Candidatus Amesbacteria bacterium RIFCSPHIGHO2_01_FULL_47_34]
MTFLEKEIIKFGSDGTGPLEKQYFIDPTSPDGTRRLARLSKEVVDTLGKIYAYKGDWGRLWEEDRKTYKWLTSTMQGEGEKRLRSLIGEILGKEFNTRRFDEQFMGQLHPQGSEAAFLGAMIGIFMNTNTIVKEVSIAEHEFEWEVLDWYAQMFGYDKNEYSANVVTGGTTANLTALWVARDKTISKLKKEGKYRRGQNMVVIAGDMKHYSIDKSVRILGDNMLFDEAATRGFKTSPADVERRLKVCRDRGIPVAAVVGIAGETETGLVDDLQALGIIAHRYGVHFHVDAAYGGPFILSEASKLFKGIENADSITVDPHKYGYVPYQCGIVLFRDRVDHALVQNGARYLQKAENKGILGSRKDRNFGLSARVEGSMGSGGVIAAWLSMKLFEREGYAHLLNHGIALANHAYESLLHSQVLRPLHQPELNGLLVGINADVNRKYRTKLVDQCREQLFNETGIYIGETDNLDCGGGCFRTVFTHPFTNERHVDKMVQNLERIVRTNLKR